MEETIRKISAIFDKMASVEITPTSNYGVHEYWMRRALKGDEKCKDTLFNWLSGIMKVDKSILNAVFDAKYKKTNESRKMNKKLIRITESDLHRIVKESVQRILNEDKHKYYYDPNDPEAYEEFDPENPMDWRTLAYLRKLRRISHEDPKSEYYEDPIKGHEAAFEKEDRAMNANNYSGGLVSSIMAHKLGKKDIFIMPKEDRACIKRARKIADRQGIDYKGRGYNLNPQKKKNKA